MGDLPPNQLMNNVAIVLFQELMCKILELEQKEKLSPEAQTYARSVLCKELRI